MVAKPGLLHYSQSGRGEPLVIVHGLFGSGKNWQSLGRIFSPHFEVITVDLRNHGQSFHDEEMNYPVMAEDLHRLLNHIEISSCAVIGHSMGGKASMLLALEHPKLISRLVIADIAPVSYTHAYAHLIEPILSLQLQQMGSRSAVDQALQADIPDNLLRGFLLQNLQRSEQRWHWKVNWSAIRQNLDYLTGFPELPGDWHINTPTRFIRGEFSDYIGSAEIDLIEEHFSNATISTVSNAGHWLHAEQPGQFASQALAFLQS